MDKQTKLNNMWKVMPSMGKEQLMKELQLLQVSVSYDEIVKLLSQTYNDLQVADHIFEVCKIDDSKSQYPKEFVDEAITKIARDETFGFVHYGVISQDLQSLHELFLSENVLLNGKRTAFTQFFAMCKRFQLDHFDALVYTVNDSLDMGKEMLQFLNLLQKKENIECHREATQFVDRFFQIFAQVNPWLEEQLQYAQATSYIAMKSAKGEKLFQAMLKQVPDETEVIYRYGLAYQKSDPKRMRSVYEKYRKQMREDSEFYCKIQRLMA